VFDRHGTRTEKSKTSNCPSRIRRGAWAGFGKHSRDHGDLSIGPGRIPLRAAGNPLCRLPRRLANDRWTSPVRGSSKTDLATCIGPGGECGDRGRAVNGVCDFLPRWLAFDRTHTRITDQSSQDPTSEVWSRRSALSSSHLCRSLGEARRHRCRSGRCLRPLSRLKRRGGRPSRTLVGSAAPSTGSPWEALQTSSQHAVRTRWSPTLPRAR
jgi:hypothetical protein